MVITFTKYNLRTYFTVIQLELLQIEGIWYCVDSGFLGVY